MSPAPLIVFCTWPYGDGEEAPEPSLAVSLAQSLVAEGLAACVSIGAPARSIYRWQGETETATELPLIIKTTEERYAALETALTERHPYDVPEILAVPATHGLPAYVDWMVQCTGC